MRPPGIIGWFADNHVTANLMMFFILLTGLYAVFTLKKESFPPVHIDAIDVRVLYLGAAPEEVEEGVIIKIEEAIEGIEGIREIQSIANEGFGQVSARIEKGFEVTEVMDEIKLAVDGISTFPSETERPVISRVKWQRGAIAVQVGGDLDETAMKILADEIRDELIALPEISAAELRGARPFEISVEIPEVILREYGMTLEQVAQVIRNWSIDLPGGSIRTESGDIRLRMKGQAYTGEDFRNIVLLTRADGARIRLGDIANVTDGFAEVDSYAFFNGKRSLVISVKSLESQNDLDVGAAVREYVEQRRASLPDGVVLETWGDSTVYLKAQLNMMLKNMVMGAVLVFFILGIFLHAKIALWVIVGIPVAFLGAFMMMPLPGIDISVNGLSLFGFILVLGIVVDDAIIIAESVYTETEEHGYTLANIVAGAQRVAIPASFGVLTTIVAFVPMLLVSGPTHDHSAAIGWVVVLCLAFSLVESKLILPSHLAMMKSSHKKSGIADVVDRGLKRFIARVYQPTLRRCIEYRYATLAGFFGLLIIALGLVVGGKVRYVFFPDMDNDFIMAKVELVDGAPESLIHDIVERLSAELDAVNDQLKLETGSERDIIENTFAYIRDGKSGFFQVELSKSQHRNVTPKDVETRWRARVGEIAGTKELKFQSSMNMGGGAPIAYKLTGRNYPQLEKAAEELVQHLRGFEGVYEFENSSREGPREVRMRAKPEAEALGITLSDLARQVRSAFYGAEAQRIQRGEHEVKVMVRYPRAERRSMGNLESMWIRTPDGRELPFQAVAEIELDRGYNNIRRINGRRAITVSAEVNNAVTEPARVTRATRNEFLPQLMARYPGVTWSLTGSAREEEMALDQTITGWLLAMFGIYALMAIPLRSYLQPLIIMGVIPFGIVGAIVGHMIVDIPLNVISLLGIIALSGVVVNDSLIMVDFVNKRRQAGESEIDAAILSGSARLRPILLTSLTTFFGLCPIILERGAHANLVIPMAVSLAFGILFATFITLILIPSMYVVLGDVRALFGLDRSNQRDATPAVGG